MRYRGLDPRTRLLRWGLLGVIVGAVVLTWGGAAVTSVATWVTVEHDRLPWYATRLLGLVSYLAITGSVVYGLLLSTGILDAIAHRTVSFALHQDLSGIGLGLAMVHAAVLMIDSSVPYSPLEVLVPFAGWYEPLWVGVGQVTLYLVAIVTLSFHLRKRIGQKRWRRLHHVTFLAFLGAALHGLMAGTDSTETWAHWMYVLSLALVASLTVYRVIVAVAARSSAPVSSPESSALPGSRTSPAPPAAPAPVGTRAP